MNYKQCYTYKFLIRAGIIFWFFIIPSIIMVLNVETGAPEPTLFFVILFICGFLLSILMLIGSYIIIPLSYFIFFILFILDIYRVCFNKLPNQVISNQHAGIHIALAILGFIFGGITSALTILSL